MDVKLTKKKLAKFLSIRKIDFVRKLAIPSRQDVRKCKALENALAQIQKCNCTDYAIQKALLKLIIGIG